MTFNKIAEYSAIYDWLDNLGNGYAKVFKKVIKIMPDTIADNPHSRRFVVKYKDMYGKEHNVEIIAGTFYDKYEFVKRLCGDYRQRGLKIKMVVELLNGYSHSEMERIAEINPKKAFNNIQIIYAE